MTDDTESVNLCAAQDWKHVCHLLPGHHGPHACSSPDEQYGCDFIWPNENETTPCPSTMVAVLGVVGEPAIVRCGLLEGHGGFHRMSVAWGAQPDSVIASMEALERSENRFTDAHPSPAKSRSTTATTTGEPMTLTEPDTQVPPTNAPNIVEYVKASEIKPGDRLLVLTTIYTVSVVTPYNLASAKGHGIEDKPVVTSSPTVNDGRWRVLHILTEYGGMIRFPHEDIARLAHIGQTPKPGPQPPSVPTHDHDEGKACPVDGCDCIHFEESDGEE